MGSDSKVPRPLLIMQVVNGCNEGWSGIFFAIKYIELKIIRKHFFIFVTKDAS